MTNGELIRNSDYDTLAAFLHRIQAGAIIEGRADSEEFLRAWLDEEESGEEEQARWLHRKRNGYAVLVCSNCGKEKEGYTCTAYCPSCGRRMTEEAAGCE